MRYFVLFAISTLALITFVARLSGTLGATPRVMSAQTSPASSSVAAAPKAAKKGSDVAYVRLDRHNSFSTDIEIEGKTFKAIIDTGASTVAIRYEDAKQLGVFRKGETWNRAVSTANGVGRAMTVRLNNLAIGDLMVYDVEAMVLSPGALGVNLVGMSLLRRLSKFEVRPDVIVLQR